MKNKDKNRLEEDLSHEELRRLSGIEQIEMHYELMRRGINQGEERVYTKCEEAYELKGTHHWVG